MKATIVHHNNIPIGKNRITINWVYDIHAFFKKVKHFETIGGPF